MSWKESNAPPLPLWMLAVIVRIAALIIASDGVVLFFRDSLHFVAPPLNNHVRKFLHFSGYILRCVGPLCKPLPKMGGKIGLQVVQVFRLSGKCADIFAKLGGFSCVFLSLCYFLHSTAGGSSPRRVYDPAGRLEQCPRLHIKPAFPAVGLEVPPALALEIGRGAEPLCNLPIIAEGAAAPRVLGPVCPAV